MLLLGSGKTEPVILATLHADQGRCTVLFLPLKSMHEQYKIRAKKSGITCEVWTPRSTAENHPQWLIVQIELADRDQPGLLSRLKSYLQSLLNRSRIARVLIDEAHLLSTHDHFRSVMDHIKWLGSLSVNLVLLTATCPPPCEKKLMERVGCVAYRVLRSPVSRPNIQYKVCQVFKNVDDVVVNLVKVIMEKHLGQRDVVIVFCLSRSDAEETAHRLGIPVFHSLCEERYLEEVLEGLRSGKHRAVVATSLLSVGFDIPTVRFVVHQGCPRSVTDYEQESGRAGRDGNLAFAIVVVNKMQKYALPNVDDAWGTQAIRNTMHDESNCRRLRTTFVLDGEAKNCPVIERAVFCDNCQNQLDHPEQGTFSSRLPEDLICILESRGTPSFYCLMSLNYNKLFQIPLIPASEGGPFNPSIPYRKRLFLFRSPAPCRQNCIKIDVSQRNVIKILKRCMRRWRLWLTPVSSVGLREIMVIQIMMS
jgi:superfamily II DNA helicase RecQ